MSLWIKEILPRNGSYVKSLAITGLRSEWFDEPPNPPFIESFTNDTIQSKYHSSSWDLNHFKFIEEGKEYWEIDSSHHDNLAICSAEEIWGSDEDRALSRLYGIGPENTFKILSLCQNLTKLHLVFPYGFAEPASFDHPDSIQASNFSINFTSLLPFLQHLQHLKIQGSSHVLIECFEQPIPQLPLLESLELVQASARNACDMDRLPACLSELTALKHLVLKDVHYMAGNWFGFYKGPPQLVKLVIQDCIDFCVSEILFLNTWAPKLTHLELKIVEPDDRPQADIEYFNPRSNKRRKGGMRNFTKKSFEPYTSNS